MSELRRAAEAVVAEWSRVNPNVRHGALSRAIEELKAALASPDEWKPTLEEWMAAEKTLKDELVRKQALEAIR